MPMTDADVAAMTRGERTAVAKRIAKHSATKPVGTLTGRKTAPPRITAAEMDHIRRTGRPAKQVTERLAKAAAADVSPKPTSPGKDSPKVDAPRRRAG